MAEHFQSQMMLRQTAVLKITGVSAATIWRWKQAGLFPRRIRLGPNVVGWAQKELEDWLTHRRPIAFLPSAIRTCNGSSGWV
jgi:prophage regulatory protein